MPSAWAEFYFAEVAVAFLLRRYVSYIIVGTRQPGGKLSVGYTEIHFQVRAQVDERLEREYG